MRFYILDDTIGAVKALKSMIKSRNLGDVVGAQTSSEKAVEEIRAKKPDIVVLNLLMPVKDGITVVNEIKETNPEIDFVMGSQVVDKNMVSDAYQAGIEFFINKPNNLIEIESVLRRVAEKRQMAFMLREIRSVMSTTQTGSPSISRKPSEDTLPKVRKILGSVGMLGESGTKDIIHVCQMMKKENASYDSKSTLNTYAFSLGEDPKIVRQRIRRAVKRGLTNTAALGIEDYYSDLFEQYAHSLFNFDAIRSEMDLLRGKSAYGGRPSIDKFFEGLQMLCEL